MTDTRNTLMTITLTYEHAPGQSSSQQVKVQVTGDQVAEKIFGRYIETITEDGGAFLEPERLYIPFHRIFDVRMSVLKSK